MELRVRILADAGDLAADAAARDAAGWLAQHTRTSYADARADLRLADALDRERPVLAAAMREGAASLAQARVIDRALARCPLGGCGDGGAGQGPPRRPGRGVRPTELARIGRRILDVVAPEIAEAAEAARLADLEAQPLSITRLTMRRLGDGTTRISSRVPDAAGTRFATSLEAFTNPRAQHRDRDGRRRWPVTRWRAWRTRSGWARRSSSSSSPPTPPASRSMAATPPPSWSPSTSTHSRLTSPPPTSSAPDSSRPRRRAHRRPHHRRPGPAAGLHREDPARRPRRRQPPPDLGRTRRLFTPAQRKALLVRDRTCRAEGCDVPATWCEAHHLDPWHTGGRTDLANGVLLCSHHHHRAHEPR